MASEINKSIQEYHPAAWKALTELGKRIYLPKILQAQSGPLHMKPRISVGGSVWHIWVELQAINALTIAEEQGLKALIAPVVSGITTSVTSAIVAFMIMVNSKE